MGSTPLSLSDELDALRELRKFTEALQKLDSLSETAHLSIRDGLFIASEKAQTLYEQGYFDRAEIVLGRALDWSVAVLDDSWASEERSLRDLLRAKQALTMVVTKGDARSVLDETILAYLPEDVVDVPGHLTVFLYQLNL